MADRPRRETEARLALLRKELGQRLAGARKRLGLTQASAASGADLSDETLSRLERGTQGASLEALARLADLYRVPLSELLGPTGRRVRDERAQGRVVQEVIALLRTQPTEQIELARDLLRVLFRRRRGRGQQR